MRRNVKSQWIETSSGLIVDYKAQMWFPRNNVMHGVFSKSQLNSKDLEYRLAKKTIISVSDFIFAVLT